MSIHRTIEEIASWSFSTSKGAEERKDGNERETVAAIRRRIRRWPVIRQGLLRGKLS